MKKIYLLLFILSAFSAKSQVVISEVYGGGGNSGSTYKNDFIELYNNGPVDIVLTGWSVQYASTTGTTWQKTNLSGTIKSHGYLPTTDVISTIPMEAGANVPLFLG
jgi:hypothetical protein